MTEYSTLQKLYYADKSSQRDSTTKAEASKRLHDPSTFRTGIETRNGELFLAMPVELSVLSERLLRVERKVSHLWRDLPGIARRAYLRSLIMAEIVSTNEIEGVRSTRRQIEAALEQIRTKQPTNSEKRFREFASLYLELTNQSHIYPSNPADIRAIYDAVVSGELDEGLQPDGELFRRQGIDVVSSTEEVVHSGVTPESEIIRMLGLMISLVDASGIPPTFAAIISHFVFEYIHPFYDGNGRTGRYLLALYLSEPLSIATILSLSSTIAQNKARYYRAFTDAESPMNHGEMTFFVITIMELIRLAQDALMEELERKAAELQFAEAAIDTLLDEPYSLSAKEAEALFLAVQHHLFAAFAEVSQESITEHMGIGRQAARKHSKALEQKGLLKPSSSYPLRFKLTEEATRLLDIAGQ